MTVTQSVTQRVRSDCSIIANVDVVEGDIKRMATTAAGIRAGNFNNTVRFLETVLGLEALHRDKEVEFAQFRLPAGGTLEVFGPKNIWQPFTTPPDWVVLVADVLHTTEGRDPTQG